MLQILVHVADLRRLGSDVLPQSLQLGLFRHQLPSTLGHLCCLMATGREEEETLRSCYRWKEFNVCRQTDVYIWLGDRLLTLAWAQLPSWTQREEEPSRNVSEVELCSTGTFIKHAVKNAIKRRSAGWSHSKHHKRGVCLPVSAQWHPYLYPWTHGSRAGEGRSAWCLQANWFWCNHKTVCRHLLVCYESKPQTKSLIVWSTSRSRVWQETIRMT